MGHRTTGAGTGHLRRYRCDARITVSRLLAGAIGVIQPTGTPCGARLLLHPQFLCLRVDYAGGGKGYGAAFFRHLPGDALYDHSARDIRQEFEPPRAVARNRDSNRNVHRWYDRGVGDFSYAADMNAEVIFKDIDFLYCPLAIPCYNKENTRWEVQNAGGDTANSRRIA